MDDPCVPAIDGQAEGDLDAGIFGPSTGNYSRS